MWRSTGVEIFECSESVVQEDGVHMEDVVMDKGARNGERSVIKKTPITIIRV